MKNRIPEYFHLDYEEILDKNSFLLNDVDYDVKCVFQIWKKSDIKRDKIKPILPEGFSYTKDKNLADFSVRRVGVYAGKAFNETDKSEQSHYFIILDDKANKEFFINSLNEKKWEDFTVGPRSISKPELNRFINQINLK
jgi:hypothetical protein